VYEPYCLESYNASIITIRCIYHSSLACSQVHNHHDVLGICLQAQLYKLNSASGGLRALIMSMPRAREVHQSPIPPLKSIGTILA
jgi:hypothetical protein